MEVDSDKDQANYLWPLERRRGSVRNMRDDLRSQMAGSSN